MAQSKWLAEREAELLPVSYFHVVFTLPSQLRDVAYQNKRVIYDLLMKAAAETTLAIAADPKRLGARIGITAVLHTWGSAMTHHPHVHMIVPGGGLSLDGARWVAARANFLVHVNVLARLFRGKMLAMLMDAHRAGQLKFFNSHAELADKRTFKRFVAPLRRIKWVVFNLSLIPASNATKRPEKYNEINLLASLRRGTRARFFNGLGLGYR